MVHVGGPVLLRGETAQKKDHASLPAAPEGRCSIAYLGSQAAQVPRIPGRQIAYSRTGLSGGPYSIALRIVLVLAASGSPDSAACTTVLGSPFAEILPEVSARSQILCTPAALYG